MSDKNSESPKDGVVQSVFSRVVGGGLAGAAVGGAVGGPPGAVLGGLSGIAAGGGSFLFDAPPKDTGAQKSTSPQSGGSTGMKK